MDLGLGGKRALVLGGSRGIGWYTARLLAEEGCSAGLWINATHIAADGGQVAAVD